MNQGDISKFGIGGIDVSDNAGLSAGIRNLNLGDKTFAPTPAPAVMNLVPDNATVKTGIDKIRDYFPNFKVYSAEQLANASAEQLTSIFSELNDTMDKANSMRVQAQTQIEGKEAERKKIISEIKDKFGVETIEELQAIKNSELANFVNLMKSLEGII